MADRYWVGGGSSTNWNATGNTNWAATSGGANNQSVPTTGDTVIFDSNSGSGISVMNLTVSLAKMDAHGFTGTLTHNSGITITITGAAVDSLRLPNTGTYNAAATSSLFTLTSTSGTTDITSNGKRMGGLTFNGSGGTFRLLDALRVDVAQNSAITLTAGTFNANNFNVTTHIFSSSNSNTRTITMGSGTWTVGGNAASGQNFWTTSTVTGLTFNKDTANIVVPSNGLSGARTMLGGGLTYNGLTIDSNTGKGAVVLHAATFGSLSIGAGNVVLISTSGPVTVSSAFTLTGTAALPISLISGTPGTVGTLTISGSCSLTWGACRDITFSGGTMTGTNVLDLGNNTGLSSTPPGGALTAADIAAAVWDEPAAGNVTAGTFGAQLKTVVDAIDAKTTNLPSDPADASVIAGRFDTLDATLAGTLLADVRKVNDIAVTGSGTEVDPWGP